MYILLDDNNIVLEIIPDEDPVFPGVPVASRYAPDFVSRLTHFGDGIEVEQNWVYDPETSTFSAPPQASEPEPEPNPGEMISTADLDAAYKEGVNSYE